MRIGFIALMTLAALAPAGCRWLPFWPLDPIVEAPRYEEGMLAVRARAPAATAIDAAAEAFRLLEIEVEETDHEAGRVIGRTLDEKQVRVLVDRPRGTTRVRVSVRPEGIEARERMILDQILRLIDS